MNFDTWLHSLELFMVLGIAFTVWYVKKRDTRAKN